MPTFTIDINPTPVDGRYTANIVYDKKVYSFEKLHKHSIPIDTKAPLMIRLGGKELPMPTFILNKLKTYILEANIHFLHSITFTCHQFVEYLYDIYSGTKLQEAYVSTAVKNSLEPGDNIRCFNGEELMHTGMYLGEDVFLSKYGRQHPLRLTSLKYMTTNWRKECTILLCATAQQPMHYFHYQSFTKPPTNTDVFLCALLNRSIKRDRLHEATNEESLKGFKKQIGKYHSDINRDDNAFQKFQLLLKARALLIDPTKRYQLYRSFYHQQDWGVSQLLELIGFANDDIALQYYSAAEEILRDNYQGNPEHLTHLISTLHTEPLYLQASTTNTVNLANNTASSMLLKIGEHATPTHLTSLILNDESRQLGGSEKFNNSINESQQLNVIDCKTPIQFNQNRLQEIAKQLPGHTEQSLKDAIQKLELLKDIDLISISDSCDLNKTSAAHDYVIISNPDKSIRKIGYNLGCGYALITSDSGHQIYHESSLLALEYTLHALARNHQDTGSREQSNYALITLAEPITNLPTDCMHALASYFYTRQISSTISIYNLLSSLTNDKMPIKYNLSPQPTHLELSVGDYIALLTHKCITNTALLLHNHYFLICIRGRFAILDLLQLIEQVRCDQIAFIEGTDINTQSNEATVSLSAYREIKGETDERLVFYDMLGIPYHRYLLHPITHAVIKRAYMDKKTLLSQQNKPKALFILTQLFHYLSIERNRIKYGLLYKCNEYINLSDVIQMTGKPPGVVMNTYHTAFELLNDADICKKISAESAYKQASGKLLDELLRTITASTTELSDHHHDFITPMSIPYLLHNHSDTLQNIIGTLTKIRKNSALHQPLLEKLLEIIPNTDLLACCFDLNTSDAIHHIIILLDAADSLSALIQRTTKPQMIKQLSNIITTITASLTISAMHGFDVPDQLLLNIYQQLGYHPDLSPLFCMAPLACKLALLEHHHEDKIIEHLFHNEKGIKDPLAQHIIIILNSDKETDQNKLKLAYENLLDKIECVTDCQHVLTWIPKRMLSTLLMEPNNIKKLSDIINTSEQLHSLAIAISDSALEIIKQRAKGQLQTLFAETPNLTHSRHYKNTFPLGTNNLPTTFGRSQQKISTDKTCNTSYSL